MDCSSDRHGDLKVQERFIYRRVPEGGDSAGKKEIGEIIIRKTSRCKPILGLRNRNKAHAACVRQQEA